MQEKTHVSHSMESHPHEDLEGFDTLTELALDMRSSWDGMWRRSFVDEPGVLVESLIYQKRRTFGVENFYSLAWQSARRAAAAPTGNI